MDGDVLMEEPKVIQEEEEAGSIQPLTQPEDDDFEQKLWGYLSPCLSRRVQRVNLFRTAQEYTIGRNLDNMVILSGLKISNFHAVLKWNGLENAAAVVQIEDTSSNGTYINGENIGKGQQRLLKDGNEIAFGSPYKSLEDGGLYDYRFIFRALVSGAVKRALYNSYDISTELGKGSFATVYKALHRRSGEWVAVKVIHETHRHSPTNTASDVAQLNQSRELTLMKDLHHPSICQLREVFWNANGSIDLVLELVEGGDLLDLILIKGGLSEAMSKHITYQLCQALAYIHQKGITHRDLKPENVLLTKDNPPIVKVADFGLAKVVSSLTMLRTMCGTPSYLAPEVVTQQNSSGYDSLVDSWSVGVIEFSMLTNTTPFIESSVTDLRARTASRDIDWSQLEELYLTEEAIDFVRLLLDFNPRERMTMADALQHRWLINYIFAYPNIAYPDIVGVPSFAATHALARNGEDVSMRPASSMEAEAVSQGSEDLLLNGSSNSALLTSTNANGTAEMGPLPFDTNGRSQEEGVGGRLTPPGLTLHKKSALQRHNEEAEARHRLLAPSWEMVSFMNLQGQAQAQEGQEDGLTGSPQMEELYSAAAVNNGDSGMHILHRAVALEALFNSAENFHQPRWYPETRAEMLDDLYNWAIQESARPIRWLHGPVGTGKSAIMQTLCQRLQSASDLGGAFFFKRGHATCSNAKVLFATLAYQLALNTPHLTPLISRGVEADPAVVMSQMDVQLQKLIVEPCQAVPSTHTILLIDGLDECDTHGVQVEVLRSIQTAVLQHPNKLRFLIASRSEPHLRQVFEDPTFYAIHDSTNASFDDMRAYFLDEFSRIHREHRATMRGIPGPWPSPHIVEALVDKSAGDPIYAATVIRFIDNQNFHPPERLAAIQSLESDARISSLDQLYTQILSEVPTEFRSKLGDIRYGILHYATSPLYRAATVLQMEQLLELPQGKVRSILGTLDAVLEVDAADHISVRHASFVEFLQDPQRSRILHLDIDIDTQTMSKEKPAVPCTVMHFTSSLDGPSRPPAEKTGTLVIHSPCDYKAPESQDVFTSKDLTYSEANLGTGGALITVHEPVGPASWIEENWDNPLLTDVRNSDCAGPFAWMLSPAEPALAIFGSFVDPIVGDMADSLANLSGFPVVVRPAGDNPALTLLARDINNNGPVSFGGTNGQTTDQRRDEYEAMDQDEPTPAQSGDGGRRDADPMDTTGPGEHGPGLNVRDDHEPLPGYHGAQGGGGGGDGGGRPTTTGDKWESPLHRTRVELHLHLNSGHTYDVTIAYDFKFKINRETELPIDLEDMTRPLSQPEVIALADFKLETRPRETQVDRSYASIGFVAHRKNSIIDRKFLHRGFDIPDKIYKRGQQRQIQRGIKGALGFSQGSPLATAGFSYNQNNDDTLEATDSKVMPRCRVDHEYGDKWNEGTRSYSSYNVAYQLQDNQLDAERAQFHPLEVKIGMGINLRPAGSKMPLPQISFTKRSQVLVWVSDPMSKARIRGIMVMISSYLDNITTEEALEIYEPGINIGLNQETPNTLRTKTDENEPGTISVSVAQVQEEGSSDSNKFPLAFIAKLGQRSAGRSPATYIPPHEYLARGWDANNNQWRSVLWPALDKHFRAAALERTSPVWNIQCPWKQAQKTIGATTALPCWRSSNIPGRNETCI